MATHGGDRGKLISVIGDEDTCVGFLMGGIGQMKKNVGSNFLVVGNETAVSEIEAKFKEFSNRSDIAIIIISQYIAEMIRHVLDQYTKPIPSVLEIPSKDHPYDPSKDSILRRAEKVFSGEG